MEEGEAMAGVDGEEGSVGDHLQDSSSVHFLGGVLQRGTMYMDGLPLRQGTSCHTQYSTFYSTGPKSWVSFPGPSSARCEISHRGQGGLGTKGYSLGCVSHEGGGKT